MSGPAAAGQDDPTATHPPSAPAAGGATGGTTTPAIRGPIAPIPLGQSPFFDAPPQRPNIGSLLFLSAFFFFMSSNNPQQQIISFDQDGQLIIPPSELDRNTQILTEYKQYLNGTLNDTIIDTESWASKDGLKLIPLDFLPKKYEHSGVREKWSEREGLFYGNITGFYRDANVHFLDFTKEEKGSRSHQGDHYWDWTHDHDPMGRPAGKGGHKIESPLDTKVKWNETEVEEKRGSFNWINIDQFEFNINERNILPPFLPDSARENTTQVDIDEEEWSWVGGTMTIRSDSRTEEGEQNNGTLSDSIDYQFSGIHYLKNGTYDMYAIPDGKFLDIRNIPRSLVDSTNTTKEIILRELIRKVKELEMKPFREDAKKDDVTSTSCPLHIHLTVPPIGNLESIYSVETYEAELQNPTGLRSYIPSSPKYWEGVGLGGVAVSEECGFAFGIEGGKGLRLEEFWRKTTNYASFAALSQLVILLLLVRQMEVTRSPSSLTRLSVYSILLMAVSDSWTCSAHIVLGIISEQGTSLTLLLPAFLALCSSVVFAPRYALMAYRIQLPEGADEPSPPRPAPVTPASPQTGDTTSAAQSATDIQPTTAATTPSASAAVQNENNPNRFVRSALYSNPFRAWLGIISLFLILQFTRITFFLFFIIFVIHSFWIPQIWRNASKGHNLDMDNLYIFGMSISRLAIPLYLLACPDNVFFLKPKSWIWLLIPWHAFQISILLAQRRFGPTFFLPKRFAPASEYDYHPLLPAPSDKEAYAGSSHHGVSTCSICMEEIDIRPTSSALQSSNLGMGMGGAGEAMLGNLAGRNKNYALAPCDHMFHTKCLAQWLSIKTICPLCKRPLPPL